MKTTLPTLRYQCPSCQHSLTPIEPMHEATALHQRTCRACGETWQLKITPRLLKKVAGIMHIADFTFIARRPR
jgi:hypothetical protein